jgi:hypothetical protein
MRLTSVSAVARGKILEDVADFPQEIPPGVGVVLGIEELRIQRCTSPHGSRDS